MEKLAKYSGIVPEMLLWDRSRVSKLISLLNEFGIVSLNELTDRFKYVII